jgi:hypothetical protein
MEQLIPTHCPRCEVETIPGQHFCPNCGVSMQDVRMAVYSLPQTETEVCSLPQITVPQTPVLRVQARGRVQGRARAEVFEQEKVTTAIPVVPRKSSYGKFVIIGLTVIILLGLVSFASWQWYSNTVQPPVTSRAIRAQVKYAGLTYLVSKVSQSQYFLDDPLTTRDGMVRVSLQAWNALPFSVSINYDNVARLVLPGGKSLSPVTTAIKRVLKAGTTQSGYLDFSVPVPVGTKSEQLAFQLGGADEAVVTLPLNGHADVSQYASHEKPLRATVQYEGLNWTLLSVTSAWNIAGQQAKKGMRYLTFALSVTNPLGQLVIPGSPFDYVRLQVGTVRASPEVETLPVSFVGGTISTVGSVTFLVPRESSKMTFMLLAQPQSGFAQAVQNVLLR